MIGRITGILEVKRPPFLLVNVHGLGYEIQAPMSTIYQLPEIQKEITLHTHFVVREDAQLLYGFYTDAERMLFRTLIKISGVGPKLALTILSGMEVSVFVQCIELGDSAQLVRLPGVGKKTAERLVIEMRDKISGKNIEPQDTVSAWLPLSHSNISCPIQDAVSALISLGYKAPEANRAITRVKTEDASCEILIRKALQELAKA